MRLILGHKDIQVSVTDIRKADDVGCELWTVAYSEVRRRLHTHMACPSNTVRNKK